MEGTVSILDKATTSSIAAGDKVFVNQDDALKQIDYDQLATAILNKLSTQSFSSLGTSAKNVIGALNELNSNTRTIFRGNITDLDNTPYSHILECGSNPTGMPSQMGNSCMVFQFNPQANYSAQLAFSFGADKIAIRRKNGGDSWTDWKYFTAN